jgi:hypothetical protein
MNPNKTTASCVPLLSITGVLSIITSIVVVYAVILPEIDTTSFFSVFVNPAL